MRRISVKAIPSLILLLSGAVSSAGQSAGRAFIPEDTLITLERVALFDCPVCTPQPNYKITVRADGTVIFQGNRHTRVTGIARGRIGEDKVQELVSAFERADYFKRKGAYERAEDGCPMLISDRPYAYTSIQINGGRKAVSHYYGCVADDDSHSVVYPQELFELEKKIDKVVNAKQWVE